MRHPTTHATLRHNLVVLVKRAGYPTLELFAHENGIEKSTLSRILSGNRDPRLGTLERIRTALEVDWRTLLDSPL